MQEIIDHLHASPAFYVATADKSGNPHNRPFSLVFDYNGKVMFGTNKNKLVFHDLSENPKVEICASDDKKGTWLRFHGIVGFEEDKACKAKMFEVMPQLLSLYPGGAENPDAICFYIKEGQADFYNYSSMNAPSKTIKV